MNNTIDKKDLFYTAIILFLLFILMGVLYNIDNVEDGCNEKWAAMLNESGYGYLIYDQTPLMEIDYVGYDIYG